MTVGAPVQVGDSRPAMAHRALSFISTQHKARQECFELVLSKTSSANLCLEIEFRGVEIVADAGLLMKFLSWIGQGGRRALASAVDRVHDYHYLLVRPGGLAVRTTLSDAQIHLVTSFQVGGCVFILF